MRESKALPVNRPQRPQAGTASAPGSEAMAGESAGENLYARLCHCRAQLAKESKTPALDIATDVALQLDLALQFLENELVMSMTALVFE